MKPVIETEQLSKWYGPVIAINRMSIRIPPGITALLGPNGAGKSTLIRLLTGHIRPSSGNVRIFGEPVHGNHEILRRIGVCPDFDNFYEDMSGLEFTTMCAKLSGVPERSARARAAETLDRLGLLEARTRAIRGYSKGMRQRVKLAQALVHEPDIMFLDEPMTGLDPMARYELASFIRDFAKAGRSVLVSSHILHEIETMTDQLLLMSHGLVLAEGDVHQIRESLENHPFIVKVRCSEPRAFARRLIEDDAVIAAEVDDGDDPTVILRTTRAGAIFQRLPEIALEMNVFISEISSPDDNIEKVFEYLTGK